MKKQELLIPAGNLEKMRTAVLYGADAVYIGVSGLSLRANNAEMPLADLAAAVNEAHTKSVKVYAAINTFARNADLQKARKIIPELAAIPVDALIVSDTGMIRLIRNLAPQLPIHLSTQANTTNAEAVRFWHDQGIKRIVLARELTLREIGEIAAAVPEMELELFVHGAMCMAYSGRCYLSAYRNQRSANEGDCTQACRWEYLLYESTRPTDPMVLQEDEHYTYLLSSKDLCLIEHLPEVLASGVVSLKIEGRMKSTHYVAVVARTYRRALNALMKNQENYQYNPDWIAELKKISNRGYTTGFAFSVEKINETSPDIKYHQTSEMAGTVLQFDPVQKRILLGVRNHLAAGDEIELLLPDDTFQIDTSTMADANGKPLKEANNDDQVYLPFDQEAPIGAVLRKKVK